MGAEMSTNSKENFVEFENWDWLPKAALEIEGYLKRMLAEADITPHAVNARAKMIRSFRRKVAEKGYESPINDVTDSVAVRIITYSLKDRESAAVLIRDRFRILSNEDRNPGDEKPAERRGYDCQHIVISGEKPVKESGWLVVRGDLARYFDNFGGLEIQIRTVAAHAWAEFEHANRYKGQQYKSIDQQDQKTIDGLFGAASDARRALDETFLAIESLLANPTHSSNSSTVAATSQVISLHENDAADGSVSTPLDAAQLRKLLAFHFPQDGTASTAGINFACELATAIGLDSVELLEAALDSIDSERVRLLMALEGPVTQVRRLDDELLAIFGDEYIEKTKDIGNVVSRDNHLAWRFDRLRGKTQSSPYALDGTDCPDALRQRRLPAARVVREVARIVANANGAASAAIPGAISTANDLDQSTRAKAVRLDDGTGLWIATNLNRDYSEQLFTQILQPLVNVDLQVVKDGVVIASGADEALVKRQD